MSETRNIPCQITGETVGTLTLPDGTPERVWARKLKELSDSMIVSRPEVIEQWKERNIVLREPPLRDALEVIKDTLQNDVVHTPQRIRNAYLLIQSAITDLVNYIRTHG